MIRFSFRPVLFLCLVLFMRLTAFAQSADLSGMVHDPTGAPVANAEVRAINSATLVERRAKTNEVGIYDFPFLPPGEYNIVVQLAGFTTAELKKVVLSVEDKRTLDVMLQLGSVNETVTVEAGALVINTTDGSVSTVVDRQFVENIPLNGRSFQTLLLLTPGAVVTPTSYSQQGQFSFNGQRPDANYFSVDGVSGNNGVAGGFGLVQSAGGSLPGLTTLGSTQSLVSVDAMQEFRIQTSTFAPEFGRTPGGQISIVTRSGSNQRHGTAFEYFRNDVLDANNWFADHNNVAKPRERQNDFGGVLGGPIWKDHTFFFFSYEGLRLRQPLTVTTLVPSNAAKALLPASVKPLVNLFPVSNNSDLGNGMAQFTASYSNPASVDAYSIRVDHSFGPKVTLFGRYSDTPSNYSQRDPNGVVSVTNPIVSRTRTMTLGVTNLITANASNEFRANYSNARVASTLGIDNFGGATPQDTATLLQNFSFPGSPGNDLFALFLSSTGALASAGRNAINEQRDLNFVDTVSFVTGAHNIKAGVDYRWLAPISGPRNYSQAMIFSGVLGGNGTLQSGLAQVVSIQAAKSATVLVKNFSMFGQDTWKLTPRLTLTYGLRWDVNPPSNSKDPNSPFFTVLGADNPATMTLAPAGTPMYATTWANIAPRLGIAYSLRQAKGWETVLRGGFGLFYDLGSTVLEGSPTSGWPFVSSRTLANIAVPLTTAQAAPAAFSKNSPVTSTIYASVPDLQLPRTWQYNVALEQSLGAAQSASLTYVGATGRDMIYTYLFSAPNPNFTSGVELFTNRGTSDYHALQSKFQRRLSHGVQVLASYTWSHSLDTGSDSLTGNPPVVVPNVNTDRGNSDFDIRHSFSGAVVYGLPSPAPRLARAIFGGWSLSDLITAWSAPPVNVRASVVTINGVSFTPRPNVVAGQPFYLYGSQYPGGMSLNKAAFIAPSPGTQGNFGRNGLRGFGAWQMDFSVQRQFQLTEKLGLQFSTDFFNILNHPNFGQPINTITSSLFGQSTSTLAASLGSGGATGGFSPLYQIGGPRSIQLALKVQF